MKSSDKDFELIMTTHIDTSCASFSKLYIEMNYTISSFCMMYAYINVWSVSI